MSEKALTAKDRERATLYVLEALSVQEREAFESRLSNRPDLREYVTELESTLTLTSTISEEKPSEDMLQGQRNMLRGAIEHLESRKSGLPRLVGKVTESLKSFTNVLLNPRQPALAVASYIVIAFLAGRFLVPSAQPVNSTSQPVETASSMDIRKLLQSGVLSYADISLNQNEQSPVELSLHTNQEVSVSGTANDEEVQSLLGYLVLNDQNPGNRLKALDLLASVQPQQELKMVLVSSVLSDPNPGVRLRSIKLLKQFPRDELMINACQKVLLEDTNEAIRMAALDILAKQPTKNMLPILHVVSAMDENDYIRNKSRELLVQLNDPNILDIDTDGAPR